jgi:cytochrome c556
MKVTAILIAMLLACCAGCSSMGVEPWERNILAKKEMQLTADPLEAATDDHIYFSKEATSGGRGFGGGGCGCN